MGTDQDDQAYDIYDLMDFEEVVEPDPEVSSSQNDPEDYGWPYNDDDYYPRQDYSDCYECY